MTNASNEPIVEVPQTPKAFACPKCQFEYPEEDVEHNPSTDRWFICPSCKHRWNVSPIADSN
ncbi:MAG TPA: hypothetical protein VGH34_23585 [Vicinamibacterales bacterium]|jgi:transcription elongation factor Elf1